ncbi:MAG: hypothetical protein KDA75_15415, partial [Planctomycetaceae bacterium]|nr:hypothetical protein [Planctomycetaceae bacterium]
LDPLLVTDCDRLLIRAADGSEPVLILRGRPSQASGNRHVVLRGGVLQLQGLHVLAAAAVANEPGTVFGVEGGTLHLSDCSVTVPDGAGPAIVGSVTESSQHDYPSRVLVEHCLIRGPRATAISARGPQIDVVIGGSLLASDSSPLIVAENLPAPPAKEDPAAKPEGQSSKTSEEADASDQSSDKAAPALPLAVRVYGSVLTTSSDALRLKQAPGDSIRRGTLQLRRSICLGRGSESATLVSLTEWPTRGTSVSGQARIAGLTWKQDRSWLAGWPTLTRISDADAQTVDDWRTYWGAPLETGSYSADAVRITDSAAEVRSDQLSPLAALVPAEVTQGTPLGPVEPLPAPPQKLIDQHQLLSGRPALPESFSDLPDAQETLQYDLRGLKQNLNELLNGPGVPDGSYVVFTGLGLVNIPPLHLHGKNLTLEFQQSGDGAPFTLRPDAAKGDIPEASIIVDGGRLNLIGARVQASPTRSREIPLQLVLVRDGEFTARYCQFEGSPAVNDPDRALVEWRQSKDAVSRTFTYIADCQFVGSQPLLAADVDRRLLVVRNCLFASHGDGLLLRSRVGAAPVDRAHEGEAELEHNTVLFGGNALRFAGLAAGRRDPAVRVVSTACVFAPAPGPTIETATLLKHPEAMDAGNLFDWWEKRNGYAASIKRYRAAKEPGGGSEQSFNGDWVAFWGRDHVDGPITGPNGVLTSTILTSIANLSPPSVALSRSCAGAAGAPDGTAIGIRTDGVGPLARPKSTAPRAAGTPKPNAPGATPPVKRTGIDF